MKFINFITISRLIFLAYLCLFLFANTIGTSSSTQEALLLKFIFCPFHELTGFECPGCGMTRAFLALARLDLVSAFKLNIFSPFFFFGGLCYPFIKGYLKKYKSNSNNLISINLLLLVILYGIFRNFLKIY